MKIRRSILLACAGAFVLALFAIWLAKRPDKTPAKAPSIPGTVETAAVQPKQHEAAPTVHTNGQVVTSFTPVTGAPPLSPAKSKTERMREALAINNAPITFYGKLEDQFGSPLDGVTVKFNVHQYDASGGSYQDGQTSSDESGFFTISGYSGERLSINPEKSGYLLASANCGGIYSPLWPERERQHPDSKNPVVIKMWKLQGREPLLKINQRYKTPFTNSPIRFDLLAGKIVPSGGDIQITVNRSAGVVSERTLQDWSIKIEAVDGGIMDSSGQERITYWAPESGYQPDQILIFSTNAPYKWNGGFTKGFFVKSRMGQFFSKVGISFGINQAPDEPMDITFTGVANTNGSRNWEGDPNTLRP